MIKRYFTFSRLIFDMLLEDAENLAHQFINEIAPFCEKIRIVGSIRRRRPKVKDIDLVLVVKDWLGFTTKLQQISSKFLIDGPQQKRIIFKGQQVDLYLADHETYEPLILIRTGSWQHNVKLSPIALKKGLKLTHKGLVVRGEEEKVLVSTEKGIFDLLGLDYVEPEERE